MCMTMSSGKLHRALFTWLEFFRFSVSKKADKTISWSVSASRSDKSLPLPNPTRLEICCLVFLVIPSDSVYSKNTSRIPVMDPAIRSPPTAGTTIFHTRGTLSLEVEPLGATEHPWSPVPHLHTDPSSLASSFDPSGQSHHLPAEFLVPPNIEQNLNSGQMAPELEIRTCFSVVYTLTLTLSGQMNLQ